MKATEVFEFLIDFIYGKFSELPQENTVYCLGPKVEKVNWPLVLPLSIAKIVFEIKQYE